jgi:hypothetical protein
MKLITAVLFLCFVSSASATILNIEASGTMSSHHPTNAYFADAFPDDLTLEGKSASMSFTVDTDRAGNPIWFDPRGYRSDYGAEGHEFVTATSLVIGGVSFDSLLPNPNGQTADGAELWDQGSGYYQDDIWVGDYSTSTDQQDGYTRTTDAALALTIRSTLVDFLRGLTLDGITDLETPSDLFAGGGIEFTQNVNGQRTTWVSEDIDFDSARISVPEPGTLVMLLAGLPLLRLWRRLAQ